MPTAVRKKHMALLEPYLVGEQPSIRGEDRHREFDMFCPMHADSTRSATLDIDKGLWYCHKGCGGGPVIQLIRAREQWCDPPGTGRTPQAISYGSSNGNGGSEIGEEITEAKVRGWMESLISSPAELEELLAVRSLEPEILTAYEIGWDRDKRAYTIPVRGEDNEILNLRRYQINPSDDRRKIWSVKGMGTPPRLYPLSVLTEDNPDEIIICEGEWDALITIQMGFAAVTKTASAITWDASWGHFFAGKRVYLCHDRDEAGDKANQKISKLLKAVADVHIVELPYEWKPKHGKDLTDYWQDGHTEDDFRALLEGSRSVGEIEDISTGEPEDASVLDTFDAERVGRPLRVPVTVKGKRDPGYTVPSKFTLSCTRDAGQKCKVCPMNSAGGTGELDVSPSDPLILELMESTKNQVLAAASNAFGVPGKCSRLDVQVVDHQAVEILFARPSVDYSDGSSDYKNMKITSVGRHDTQPNNTFRVVGALQPDPRKQTNEFLAWEVTPVKTSLDTFELTEADAKLLRKFRPRKGQRPLKRLGYIARDLGAHVTKIYGRSEMHAAMDLVFHSILAFDFSGQRIERGWLEALIVGDTRTGKSEAATQLVRHYSAGEVVLCESASFAGIVGGLQQYGSGKEWAINWGAIPLNDRRLVVLDEVSGLPTDKIAEMSDVRSRGIARITKIQTEATHARTRLIWIGNPRDSSMAHFTYGVQAIKPLIGNPEDIARFDFAMSAAGGDVAPEEINRVHEDDDQEFTSEICSMLVRWAWSRKPEQVVWADGAEAAVYEAASALGKRYVEDPPLVQGANVRIKVARLAVALAARLFSTDETYQNVLVRREHVEDAVAFLDRIYNMPGFGYAEWSREQIRDRQEARAKRDQVLAYLRSRQGLAKFLRSSSTFRRQDVEEIMNVDRTDANAIINTLWESRMVRKDRGDVRVEPALHELLREVEH